ISGTSAPSPPQEASSNLFASENTNNGTGCAAPSTATVQVIDPTGSEAQTIYPCFEHSTLTDLLNAQSISWRYYTPLPGSIWTGPNAIQHMCGPNAPPPNATACEGSDWKNGVILKQAQVLKDIANGQLPSVSWVIPTGQASDHPSVNDGSGPSWVAAVVNA